MEKRTFNMLGFGLLAMTVATVSAQLLYTIIAQLIDPSFVNTTAYTYLSITMFYFFGLPTLWLFVRHLPVCEPEPKKPLGFGKLALCLLYTLGVTYIFNIFGNLLMTLVSLLRGSTVPNTVVDLMSGGTLFWNILIVSICSPIIEELVFRKLLLDRVKPFGDRIAILYTGIAFGLYHMNFYQFFYAAAIGFIFAYITLRTGSIKYSIILHMLVNFFGSVVTLAATEQGGMIGTMLLSMFCIGVMVFAVIWSIVKAKEIQLQGPRYTFSCPITNDLVWLNAGTILFIALCGVFFILNTFMV